MALFQVNSFHLPNTLYHGTSIGAIEGIRQKRINPVYWNNDKDFGPGFYTTIDMYQATRWARKIVEDAIKANLWLEHGDGLIPAIPESELPAVAVLECQPDAYTDYVNVVDFRGECREWVDFILKHRYTSNVHYCTCDRHADVICGPMADNNTGAVIKEFKAKRQLHHEEDFKWFWTQIVKNNDGKVLNGLELGDQIAFFDERMNSMVQLKGYYLYDPTQFLQVVTPNNFRREWIAYDATGKILPQHEPRL